MRAHSKDISFSLNCVFRVFYFSPPLADFLRQIFVLRKNLLKRCRLTATVPSKTRRTVTNQQKAKSVGSISSSLLKHAK